MNDDEDGVFTQADDEIDCVMSRGLRSFIADIIFNCEEDFDAMSIQQIIKQNYDGFVRILDIQTVIDELFGIECVELNAAFVE